MYLFYSGELFVFNRVMIEQGSMDCHKSVSVQCIKIQEDKEYDTQAKTGRKEACNRESYCYDFSNKKAPGHPVEGRPEAGSYNYKK